MEGQNNSRARGTKLVMDIQGNVLRWAQEEGRADGIAECTALLKDFCQPGEHKFPEEFKTFAVVFTNAAAAVHAAELEKLRKVKALAVKFRDSVKAVTDIASHARVEYREMDEGLNGATPQTDGPTLAVMESPATTAAPENGPEAASEAE